MDNHSTTDHLRIKSDYRKLGLLYGMIVGLAYALCTWGYDAITLFRISTILPGIKLGFGLLFCISVGGIAGLVAGSQDRGIVAVIIWALTGASFAWLTGHLPFDISSNVIGLLEPQFKGLEVYPFFNSAEIRLNLLMLVSAALGGISGALQLVILDAARSASTAMGRTVMLFLGIPFYILAGFMNDGQVNQIIRDPFIAVDRLVNFALEHQGETIDPQLALDMHYGSLRELEDILVDPREMIMSDYDQSTMLSTMIDLNFGETWGRCSVVNKQVTMCWPTLQLYQDGLTCAANREERCRIKLTEEAMEWLDLYRDKLGEVPQVAHEASQGTVLFLRVDTENGMQFLCRFRGSSPINFEQCESLN